MKDADDVDLVPFDPVRDDERRSGNHELARSIDPTRPTEIRIDLKQSDRLPDTFDSLCGGSWIILAYVGADLLDVS